MARRILLHPGQASNGQENTPSSRASQYQPGEYSFTRGKPVTARRILLHPGQASNGQENTSFTQKLGFLPKYPISFRATLILRLDGDS
ncbi:unnamed protein product [Rhizophagus irregularis]|nr:unnamed protein product [Rhizophagus irregularis]